MSESKHTPAPWIVQGYRIYGPLDARSKHGNGRSLVGGVVDDGIDWRCTSLGEEPDARGQFYAETMANARLMAAAPDLLAELKRLLAAVEADDIGPGHIEDARAAIAKAEGRAP